MSKRNMMLIVDDIDLNRELLKLIFDEFNIIEAINGEDALDKLRTFKTEISVMLLDIIMPVKDGIEVLKEMRKDNAISRIPVIITSAADELENGLKAIALGAMDYVTKPIEPAFVRLRVASVLQRRENERLQVQNEYLLMQREEELRHQKQLRYLAEYDTLTGIFNKRTFCNRVYQLLAQNKTEEHMIITFDIEGFKMINEMFGFDEGDRLLCYIAEKTKKNALPEDVLCRLDGDNFALCTAYYPERIGAIEAILDNINAGLKGYPLHFKVKIMLGCYVVNDRTLSVESMIDRALIVKRSIKGKYQMQCAFYNDTLRQELLYEQEIINQMEPALAEGQFRMYLQAQYNYATGELMGAEALVRWQHPKRGLIAPNEFIPIFERNGFILRLDEYMWEQACQCVRRWIDEENRISPLYISVNISRTDLYNENLCEFICDLVKKYEIEPQYLKLEITESAHVEDPIQLISVVEHLRKHGFIVEIDDFGSGYSSLNTLKDLQVDVLKLDMRFLDCNNTSKRGDRILYHVINMAKSLDLAIIAEGVETKEQADFLLSIGCEEMQGYYFAKPIPVKDFECLKNKLL
ncbi:MAG: EAL domain-containing protein [Eubacterium sp.]